MLQSWIIKAVVAFIVRQLLKFGKTIDWTKVKADVAVRVADLIPGTFFDAEATALAHAVVDAVAVALRDVARIETILNLAAAQKWAEAASVLKDWILNGWVPATVAEKKFSALLADKPTILQLAA